MRYWQTYGVHVVAVVVFFIAAFAYFSPQFQGKVVQQSDIVQYLGAAQEVREYEKETGEASLWTNSMFGGMPTYQIRTINAGNQLKKVEKVGRLGMAVPAGQFFTAMLGFYILMVLLGAGPWMSMVGALAFAFMPFNINWFEAGHITKLKTISYFPILAAGVLLAFKERYVWGGILFALGLGLNLTASHVQMTYYLFMTLIIYGVARLIYDVKKQQLPHFLKATAVLLVAGLLAIGATATNLWVTNQYQKDTMRGQPILVAEGGQIDESNSSQTDGLAWEYAMRWSNSMLDIFSSFVPGAAGGGASEPVGKNSATYQHLRAQGYNVPATLAAPLYWASPDFRTMPAYFGTAIALLFFMGIFLVKGPVKWWLALGTLLTFMLSMGQNLAWFNRLIFDYFPLYSKFRTPNSILSITGFLVPMLAILTLREMIYGKATRDEIVRSFVIGSGIMGSIALFFALLGPSMFDFTAVGDARYADTFPQDVLIADRQALMSSDGWRTLLYLGLTAGAIYLFIVKRINAWMLALALGAIVFADLWGVNRRYLTAEDFVPKRQMDQPYQATAADQQILADPDPNFRVLDLTADPFQSTRASYFHKSLGGYHAAKLQRYQDIIDQHLRQNNAQVLNMLNTKYIIGQGPEGQPIAQQNPSAYGNAWFVDSLVMVETPNAEISALNQFDPKRVAIVHREFADYVAGLNPSSTGSNIRLTEYKPNLLRYTADVQGEQLAVFSEVWYGPDKGWQAYIDGQAVDHIRVDYVLRALKVPAGQHEIEFRFAPTAYSVGTTISLISSLIIILALLGWGGYRLYQHYQNTPVAPPTPSPEPVPVAAKPKPRSKAKVKRKKKQ